MSTSRSNFSFARLGALMVCVVAAGCRNDAPPGELTILVSGDTDGWITPCGCASNQSGGLPRRADLVRQVRQDREVVVVDVGGAPGGTSSYDRLKFEAILRGEKAMGIEAHNVGQAELQLGVEALRRWQEEIGVSWVSANVTDRSGALVGRAVRLVERQGRRIALVGVLDPAFATDDATVAPVVPSILAALAQVEGQYDSVIVLAYLEEDTLREMAATLPEADVVVGGPTGQPIPPVAVGPTLLTSATNQGKFIVRLDAPPEGKRWGAKIVELNETFADNPGQMENLARYHDELAAKSFKPKETSFVAAGTLADVGIEVAGSKRCKSCHDEEHASWLDSRHAHAWESLEKTSSHVDPDCQRCHTTGYGVKGGYAGLKTEEDRIGVGCESCHGPSLAHVLDSEVRTGWADRASDSCTTCHDLENSPNFDYDTYWPKIVHGDRSCGESSEEAKQ